MMHIRHLLTALTLLFLGVISNGQEAKLTNDLIWYSPEFRSDYVSGLVSMKDGIHYTRLEWSEKNGSEINQYEYATGDKVKTIATSKSVFNDPEKSIDEYSFSTDESKMLILTDIQHIYRHSREGNYYIYNLTDDRTIPLTAFEEGYQRLASFSPSGDLVAFVRNNNIFIHDLEFREDEQITFDGKYNSIINGYPDWVYEEEFGFDKGYEWSPKGDRIAYYKFDESKVKEFQMPLYGSLYPEQYTFKYPKAGEDNSVVGIYVYDTNAMLSKRVDIGKKKDIYIPRIKWTHNNDQLCIMRLNRHQNHLEFLLTDMSKAQPFELATQVIYSEQADTYIEITDDLTFLNDGSGFLLSSYRDGYNHIYRFDMNGKEVKQITSGDWDVVEFLGFDDNKGNIYFVAAAESPLEKHVYAQNIKKGSLKKLSSRAGDNSASFSATFKYFINYNSNANTPYYITLHNSKGKEIRVLVDNSKLQKQLKKYGLSSKEFFTFKNTDGTDLNAWVIKPPDFDPSKKYPVFVTIYGGPGHNTVTNSWGGATMLWHHLLAQKGYIVASVDPRGTMFRGRDFYHSTYLQLGKLETQDFIDFAKYWGEQTYVDANRIGIQGWSYGGYMTSLCMTKGADYFKAGIAVAPVTNWRYYDSIYTERFMRTPQENADGYDDNSPINHVDKLKGAFFLVHGSADDNVHFQNSMEMVDALVNANKDFEMFVYPNKNHGIYGGTTRLHLFNKMTKFILNNL